MESTSGFFHHCLVRMAKGLQIIYGRADSDPNHDPNAYTDRNANAHASRDTNASAF
jgi:hypothetical protein